MGTTTAKQELEPVEQQFGAAQDHYRQLQAQLTDLTTDGVPSAQQVAAASTLRDQLTVAETDYLEAWRALEDARQQRRVAAHAEAAQVLSDATPRLRDAATEAEQLADQLLAQLRIVVDETQRRHTALRVSRDQNIRTHLARNTVGSWLAWRFSELKLPDYPKWVRKEFRHPLTELLLPDSDEDGAK